MRHRTLHHQINLRERERERERVCVREQVRLPKGEGGYTLMVYSANWLSSFYQKKKTKPSGTFWLRRCKKTQTGFFPCDPSISWLICAAKCHLANYSITKNRERRGIWAQIYVKIGLIPDKNYLYNRAKYFIWYIFKGLQCKKQEKI